MTTSATAEPPQQYARPLELTDLPSMPRSLHRTVYEILARGHDLLTGYHHWVVERVLAAARRSGCDTIVEAGAGAAPLTALLAEEPAAAGWRLIPCDHKPNTDAFEALQRLHPDRVFPRFEPVDYTHAPSWPNKSLVVLSGTFHHTPQAQRRAVLDGLRDRGHAVLVCEPLRPTSLAQLSCLLGLPLGLLFPLIQKPDRHLWRRILWCWAMPLAPGVFFWDGIASCRRTWDRGEWERHFAGETIEVEEKGALYQAVYLGPRSGG